MKTVLILVGIVFLGWLAAIVAIAGFILLVSLAAGVILAFRSPKEKKSEAANRSAMRRLIEREQT